MKLLTFSSRLVHTFIAFRNIEIQGGGVRKAGISVRNYSDIVLIDDYFNNVKRILQALF